MARMVTGMVHWSVTPTPVCGAVRRPRPAASQTADRRIIGMGRRALEADKLQSSIGARHLLDRGLDK